MAEDKLICYFEIDLDEISMKIPGQKHTALMRMIKWRLPSYLQSDPKIIDAINRFDDKLARLLLPFANDIAKHGSYSPPFAEAVCPVTLDNEVGPSSFDDPIWLEDDDEDDDEIDHLSEQIAGTHVTAHHGRANTRTPHITLSESTRTPSTVSTVSESDVASPHSPVIQTHASFKGKEKEPGMKQPSGEDIDCLASSMLLSESTMLATMMNEKGEVVLGTFSPLRQVPIRVQPLASVQSLSPNLVKFSTQTQAPNVHGVTGQAYAQPSGPSDCTPITPTRPSKFRPSPMGHSGARKDTKR